MVISAIKKNKAERERFILGTILNRKGLLNKVIFEWRPEGREVCIPKGGSSKQSKGPEGRIQHALFEDQ